MAPPRVGRHPRYVAIREDGPEPRGRPGALAPNRRDLRDRRCRRPVVSRSLSTSSPSSAAPAATWQSQQLLAELGPPPLHLRAARGGAGVPEKLSDDIDRVLERHHRGRRRRCQDARPDPQAHPRGSGEPSAPNARHDPRIVRRLPVDLSRTSALTVLRALQAMLAERLPTATGAAGAPAASLRSIQGEIAAAPGGQRQAVLSEPALLAGIEGAIPRADSLVALASLGAALRELLNAGMRGAGAESAAMLRAAAAAPNGQKADVLADGASLVALIAARLSRADNLRDARRPCGPRSSTSSTPPWPGRQALRDGAAAVRLAAAASPADRELAKADRDLLGRLRDRVERQPGTAARPAGGTTGLARGPADPDHRHCRRHRSRPRPGHRHRECHRSTGGAGRRGDGRRDHGCVRRARLGLAHPGRAWPSAPRPGSTPPRPGSPP